MLLWWKYFIKFETASREIRHPGTWNPLFFSAATHFWHVRSDVIKTKQNPGCSTSAFVQSPHSSNNNETHKSAIIICLICIRRPLLPSRGVGEVAVRPPHRSPELVVRSASSSKQYAIYNCRAIKQLCSLSRFARRRACKAKRKTILLYFNKNIFLPFRIRPQTPPPPPEWQPDYPPLLALGGRF